MELFIVVTILVASVALVIVQSVRIARFGDVVDGTGRLMPFVFLSAAGLYLSGIFSDGEFIRHFMADVSLVLLSLLTTTSSLVRKDSLPRICVCVMAAEVLLTLYYILCAFGFLAMLPSVWFEMITVVAALTAGVFATCSSWRRIYDIKTLLKSGTVWSYVCLAVDWIYVISFQMIIVYYLLMSSLADTCSDIHLCIAVVLLGLETVACGLRIVFDSAFVLLQKHERVIVESMKISPVNTPASNKKNEEIYKDIYERIVLHFEMKKPYLNSELTINDVVKVVYSNKVYISRAICHYTGRNFRQFVNYHRIMHSMEIFRRQPELKVTELAGLSGFNSVVSFTSSFRLFMNETPSEWCRKEKSRIVKTKN